MKFNIYATFSRKLETVAEELSQLEETKQKLNQKVGQYGPKYWCFMSVVVVVFVDIDRELNVDLFSITCITFNLKFENFIYFFPTKSYFVQF